MTTAGRFRLRRTASITAIVAGLGLLGAAGALAWRSADRAPVYRYVMGAPVDAADLGPLAPLGERHVAVQQATVVSGTGGQPLAELEVAESPTGPVLMQWRSRVDDPFLKMLPEPGEVASLAPVLARHVPAGGTVLAWWDTSRQLRLLADIQVTFNSHLGVPLFLPADWQDARARAESIEADFWKSPGDAAEAARFQRFTDALLGDEKQGIAELRALAGERPAALVLHVRDLMLLGQLAPDRIGVAFQDFPATGDMHGMVRVAHDWLTRHKYTVYSVMHPDKQRLRVVALTDAASGNTLIARLLPMVGNNQSAVTGTTLVYQTGGFWVYELPATGGVLVWVVD